MLGNAEPVTDALVILIKEDFVKITKVEPILCDGGRWPWGFVKIQTDEGVTGYGECGGRLGIVGDVKTMEPALLGKDPRPVEKLHWEMRGLMRFSSQRVVAGIETALWDIKAKALGVPLYELFGGPIRDKVRLYWSHCGTHRIRCPGEVEVPPPRRMEDITNLGREVVDRGFTALKTNMVVPGDPAYVIDVTEGACLNIDNYIVEAVVRLISTFREAVGDKIDIALDLNWKFKTEGFIRIAQALEPYNLMWLEFDTHDPEALLQVKQSTKTPICSLESLNAGWEYKPFLALHSLDVAMVNIPNCGFMESRRIAALADIYEIMIAPHEGHSPLGTLMTAHLCATVPNVKIMEFDVEAAPWRDDLVTNPPEIKNGYLILPDKPGLGTDLNEKEIAKHPWPK